MADKQREKVNGYIKDMETFLQDQDLKMVNYARMERRAQAEKAAKALGIGVERVVREARIFYKYAKEEGNEVFAREFLKRKILSEDDAILRLLEIEIQKKRRESGLPNPS